MKTQMALPLEVRPEEVARKKTFGASIELCAEIAGYSLDKTLQTEIEVDKAQFSRWQSGTEGILWPKLVRLMDACGNNAPLLWMMHQRGYDLYSIRKRESEIEKRARLAEEENAKLKSLLKIALGRTP